ncbi:hypothetical protein RFI_11331 [Reticulomyxa filosa]|uniref:Uncharacterized protein n=1 Tax=Reticulomyxa filosa TaxID=46433 RepID=X6NIS2_RETFI|nr:hypothetical protein RFI_11331 [Reticulomyxa filosa]|eukprot:ETO25803.1 hypothetical protein RFI_11331 [Reticulomyxa filosa]
MSKLVDYSDSDDEENVESQGPKSTTSKESKPLNNNVPLVKESNKDSTTSQTSKNHTIDQSPSTSTSKIGSKRTLSGYNNTNVENEVKTMMKKKIVAVTSPVSKSGSKKNEPRKAKEVKEKSKTLHLLPPQLRKNVKNTNAVTDDLSDYNTKRTQKRYSSSDL